MPATIFARAGVIIQTKNLPCSRWSRPKFCANRNDFSQSIASGARKRSGGSRPDCNTLVRFETAGLGPRQYCLRLSARARLRFYTMRAQPLSVGTLKFRDAKCAQLLRRSFSDSPRDRASSRYIASYHTDRAALQKIILLLLADRFL